MALCDGNTTNPEPRTTRGKRSHYQPVDYPYLRPKDGNQAKRQVHKRASQALSGFRPAAYGHGEQNGTILRGIKSLFAGSAMSLKNFTKMFSRKSDKSMERRAEQSREKARIKRAKKGLDDATDRLDNLLDEINEMTKKRG
jgi:hypothetical protein